MSSAVSIHLVRPVSLKSWRKFCDENFILYSPNTIGQNVFYFDDVEIHFGEQNLVDLPRLQDGSINFDAANPPESAKQIRVSTYWMGNLSGVAMIANKILYRWKGSLESDPEITELMAPARLTFRKAQKDN